MSSTARDAHHRARLLGLVTSKLVVKPLWALATLKVFDKLIAGPRSAAELAAETATHAPTLYRVLRSVAGAQLGVVHELPEQRFALGPSGALLTCDAPGSVRAQLLWYNDPFSDQAWASFLHSVQTGASAVEHVFGEPEWQHLDTHPDLAERAAAMMLADIDDKWALLQVADVAGVQRIIDVGGGTGGLLARALRAHPHLRGAVLERPGLVASGHALLRAEGVDDRAEMIGGDFLRAVPQGDAHVLSFVLHNWSDVDARTILHQCRRAATGPRRLFVLEALLPPSAQPSFFHRLDMHMLAMHGARERSEEELRALLGEAGYRVERIVTPTPGGPSLLDARAS